MTSKPNSAEDRERLLRQLCSTLERQLRSNEPCSAEEMLKPYPALSADPNFALEVIYTEFVVREQLGQHQVPEDWYRRFPQLAQDLRELFEVHFHIADARREEIRDSLSTLLQDHPPQRPFSAASVAPLDKYELLGEIARGGMGAILRGRDRTLGRELAIKVLLENHLASPEAVRRFQEEAQITGQLQHPGIPPVHEVGTFAGGRPFFAMKLIRGKTLQELLQARGTPEQDLPHFLTIFVQVCQTLAYAHSRGILHRDLKPFNIMVGAFGEVQVMDWGLAKVITEGTSQPPKESDSPTDLDGQQTAAGTVMGTPAYMAPEQARGELDKLDPRCDVFGLGGILCEILTGLPPYAGDTTAVILDKAQKADLSDALARLSSCRADQELVNLARTCLATDPDDRPRDAGVVAEKLSAYLAGVEERLRRAELEAAEAKAKARSERKARRLTLALAGSIVLTLLIVGGGWLWIEHDKTARQMATAQQVQTELIKAAGLRAEGKRGEALVIARQAEGLLEGVRELQDLQQQVHELIKSLETEERQYRLVSLLQKLRLGETSAQKQEGYDVTRADQDYARLFRDHGLDVEKLPPQELAGQIVPGLREEMAAFLDIWASVRKQARPGDDASWKHLVAAAKAVDPDPAGGLVRDALLGGDPKALEKLAASEKVKTMKPPTLTLLVHALVQSGELKQAVELLRSAQADHPGDFWINRHLAHYLTRLGPAYFKESLPYWAAAAALRPDDATVRFDLGVAYLVQKDWDNALRVYQKVVQLEPNYSEAWTNLGIIWKVKANPVEAKKAFTEAVRINPKCALAYLNLGDLATAQDDYEEAVLAYQKAIAARPGYASAWSGLGNVYRLQNKLPEADHAFRQANQNKQ